MDKKLYDFYCALTGDYYTCKKMTESEAGIFAKLYLLYFKEVEEKNDLTGILNF